MKMNKPISALLAFAVALTCTFSVYAAEDVQLGDDALQGNFDVFSPEFPNAYIEASFNALPYSASYNSLEDGRTIVGYIDAKAYCLEEYEDIGGEKVLISSRLLTKEEVDSDANDIMPLMESEQRVATKECLNLRFTVIKYSKNRYQLTANADWSHYSGLFPQDANISEPSYEDCLGILWGGEFNTSTYSGNVLYFLGDSETPQTSLTVTPTLQKYEPNKALIWSYNEARTRPNMLFRSEAMVFCDINKSTLTGNGNTTQFGAQYVHTYGKISGSISASLSLSSAGLGFSLSNAEKQWSLCVISQNGYQY